MLSGCLLQDASKYKENRSRWLQLCFLLNNSFSEYVDLYYIYWLLSSHHALKIKGHIYCYRTHRFYIELL